MKIEIGDNLRAILSKCLDRLDNNQLNSFCSSLKDFMQSGDIRRLEIDISESEGGSCRHLWVQKTK